MKNIIAWIALALSVVAIILSWLAYARTDQGSEIGRQADEIRSNIEMGRALSESRTRLENIEGEVAANSGRALDEVTAVRERLESVFSGSNEQLKGEWEKLDGKLGGLEESLRSKGAGSASLLQEILRMLENRAGS